MTNPILSLRVVTFNDQPVAEPISIDFGPAGGTIGRAPNCTLVLPDPQKAISREQARIEYRDGEYFLCDVGSNPSVLNRRALGGTREARLAHGDRLSIGAYLLEVRLGEGAPGSGRMPGVFDTLASANVLRTAMPGAAPNDPFSLASVDPLGQPGFGAQERLGARPGYIGSESDHAPPEHHALPMPEHAKPGSPFDIVPPFTPMPEAPADAPPASPAPLPPEQNDVPTERQPYLPDVTYMPRARSTPAAMAREPDAVPTRDAVTQALPPQEPLSRLPPLPEQPVEARSPARPAPSTPPAATEPVREQPALAPRETPVAESTSVSQAGADATLDALLDGLGLDRRHAPALAAPELARLIGAMLRESLHGTMTVLRSRTMTKREARLEATVIVARDNNPLKFFPDVDSALLQMFSGRGTGYLPPTEAVKRAFGDLAAHEIAVMAGTRAALAHVLKMFEPAVIEAQLDEQGVMKVLSNRKAKLWERFVELQAGIERAAADDFQKLFGDAFNEAYERQIDALRENDKAPNSQR